MRTVNFLDDLGIILLLRPIYRLMHLEMLNTIDDIGILFVAKPLRHLHRLAELILGDKEEQEKEEQLQEKKVKQKYTPPPSYIDHSWPPLDVGKRQRMIMAK